MHKTVVNRWSGCNRAGILRYSSEFSDGLGPERSPRREAIGGCSPASLSRLRRLMPGIRSGILQPLSPGPKTGRPLDPRGLRRRGPSSRPSVRGHDDETEKERQLRNKLPPRFGILRKLCVFMLPLSPSALCTPQRGALKSSAKARRGQEMDRQRKPWKVLAA